MIFTDESEEEIHAAQLRTPHSVQRSNCRNGCLTSDLLRSLKGHRVYSVVTSNRCPHRNLPSKKSSRDPTPNFNHLLHLTAQKAGRFEMTWELKKWTNEACKDIVGVCDNESVVISGTPQEFIYTFTEKTRATFLQLL